MFKIQTLNHIAPIGLNEFPRELYEVATDLPQPDAILVRSHVMHDVSIPDSVKLIGRAGAGLNNIPVDLMTQRGIPVFNTPGANANAVCELVIAGMLIASRNLTEAISYVKNLTPGPEWSQRLEKDKKNFTGFELRGKTLGIIGLGSIGVRVANAALNLGMEVIGYDPMITVSRAWELSANVLKAQNIDDVLMKADFVSFHVPLNPDTKHLINQSRLKLMKSGAVLINFARDGIIDLTALQQSLNEKRLKRYVTDFPSPALYNHPLVICFPHLGAGTREAEENCALLLAKQVRAFLEYGAVSNAANFPQLEPPRYYEGSRLAIVNANIPNMVAQISAQLASAGLNITSLLNQSRHNIAYTIIDVVGSINEKVLNMITNIHGVLQCRLLQPKPL